MPQQQLQLPSNASTSNPPLHLQLHVQSNPNTNNRGTERFETFNLPTYSISTVECNKLNLHLGQVVNTQTSPIIVEHTNHEVSEPEPRDSTRTIEDESIQIPMKQQTPS